MLPTASLIRVRRFLVEHPGYWAACLLAVMFALGVTSMSEDSAIFDEVAHVPAGYSYLRYGQYRLNPEHPPLMKDLAAIPLQLLELQFPDQSEAWTTAVNGEWFVGADFFYHLGNDADRILFWARLPILLLAIVFGAWLFRFCRDRYGPAAALLILFFYALSPSIIAHARYVTTDLGATVFMFMTLAAYVVFIEGPRLDRLGFFALALAAAQVTKFSSILLYPYLGLVAVVLTLVRRDPRPLWRRAQVYVGGLLLASVLSLVFVWAFYALHVLEMPVAEQDKLIHGSTSHPHGLTILNKVPLMKPLVQYLFGLARVFGRVAGGGPTYFNGTAKIGSFRWYFPELLLVKTQIAFLLLTLVVAVVASRRLIAKGLHWSDITAHVEQNLLAWVVGGYGLFYLSTAMAGNLNLGIRHILPIYVPFFVVVGTSVVSLYRELKESSWRTPALLALSALLAWYGLSTAFVHPAYTAYFNEFIGGPAYANGYFSDSSVDWGQDLRRLKAYLREHPEVRSVAIDYFGGGDLKYYFCSAERVNAGVPKGAVDLCRARVYEEWTPELGRYRGQYLRPEHDGPLQGYVPPEQARGSDGYVAVSETLLQNDSAAAQRRYGYLLNRTPTAKIGYSIYLYKLN